MWARSFHSYRFEGSPISSQGILALVPDSPPLNIASLRYTCQMAPSRTSPEPTTSSQGLTKEQLQTFERDGYLIIPDALDPQTVASLLKETHSLLESFSLDDHPMTKFSTGESNDHVGDDYFLDSGDKVRFFFEEGTSPRYENVVEKIINST
jgi:hypothetical protein